MAFLLLLFIVNMDKEIFDIFGYSMDYQIFFDLFNYPIDILIEIVSYWICIEEVCLLDSSFCNKLRRDDFLNLLKEVGFKQSGVEIENCEIKSYLFLNWVFDRTIKLYEIFLQVEDLHDFNLLIKLDFSKTIRIELMQYYPSDGDLSKLINSCVFLNQLILQQCEVSDLMIQSFDRLNQIQLLKIYSVSTDYSMDSMSTLATNCTSLVKLCLIFTAGNGSFGDDNNSSALLDIFKSNFKLNSINVDLIDHKPRKYNTNITLLTDMIGYCPGLRKIDLKWYGILDITLLTVFLTYYVFIEELYFEVTDMLERRTSSYTISKNKSCKLIEITDHHVINDANFLGVFKSCEFTEIILISTKPISNVSITKISQYCKHNLRSITLNNCGNNFSHQSLLYLIENCKVLNSLSLKNCFHIDIKVLKSKLEKNHIDIIVIKL
jgi:hypothetical protein